MPHSLVIGMTLSGKTSLCRALAQGYKRRKIRTAVLDPLRDPQWKADFLTPSRDIFMRYVKRTTSHALFVDESGTSIEKGDSSNDWLTTTARHMGHVSHFIAHRPQQLSPTLRMNCERLYLFTVGQKDAGFLADEWNCPALARCAQLGRGEFIFVERFRPVMRGRIIFGARPRVSFEALNAAA